MSKIDLISGKWNELVFDGRNKNYGAYEIRQKTGKRNAWSMAILFLLIALVLSGLYINHYVEEARKAALNAAENQMTNIDMAQEETPEEEKQEEIIQQEEEKPMQDESKQMEQVAFQVPEIVEEPKHQIDMSQVEKSDAVTSSETIAGSEDGTEIKDVAANLGDHDAVAPEPEKEPEPTPEPPKPVVEDKVFDVVEQMPQFNGNVMQWLSSNIKYPVVAQENGVQGRVVVGFVVDKDGSVTQVKVIKGVDPSLDREAERVVKAMPKWIPGKQNGQAVKCKYNVPVTFKLQ